MQAKPPRPSWSTEPTQPVPEKEWEWSWSPFCGILYGPVPIGLLVALPILIALAGAR